MQELPSPVLKRVFDSKNQYYLAVKFTLLDFYSKSLDRTFSFIVPAGLIVDGASIPRAFWRVIGHPLTSRYWTAFVIHDYLYGFSSISEKELRLERHEVDDLFYDLLRAEGVSWFRAKLMLNAVWGAGGFVFRKSPNKFIESIKED